MIRALGVAALCAAGLAACQPDRCTDIECVMSHAELTLDGKSAPLTSLPAGLVPEAMGPPAMTLALNGFGLLITPISAPNWGDPVLMMEAGMAAHAGAGTADDALTPVITNQPSDINLPSVDSDAPIELDIEDPNGEQPTLAFTPFDPASGRRYPHCVWLTHADRDGRDMQQVIARLGIRAIITRIDFSAGGSSCSNPKKPNGDFVIPIDACPTGQRKCGKGCIPANGSTVCCDPDGTRGAADTTSYCPNNSGGAADGACFPSTTSGSQWMCSSDGNLMSLDCPAGQHHCGELCTFIDHPCCPVGSTDPACAAPVFAGPPVAIGAKGPIDNGPALNGSGGAGGGGGGSGGGGGGGGGSGGSGGGGSCPGGQLGSARFCIQDGTSNSCSCNVDASQTSMCITPSFWQQYFHTPFPPACTPQGSSCVASDGRTMTNYCCPGLTCIGAGGPACGSGQGTCQVH